MLGLVLEGGGTKGAYHIGAYKALLDKNIKIDGITGTSIGALNGALFVQGDYKLAEELWTNLDFPMILNLDSEVEKILKKPKFDLKDLTIIKEAFSKIMKEGGLDVTPLKEMTLKYLDEDKVRNSDMDFGIVTINLTNRESLELFIEDIPEGELSKYLLGSSRLPIFKHEKSGTDIFLDGAFHDNLPFTMLKRKNYNKFILVRTMGIGIVRSIDLPPEDYIVISPTEDLGSTLNFNPERSIYNMNLGYYDALRALEGLKGNLYYIDTSSSPDFYFNKFAQLKTHQIKKLSNSMTFNNKEGKRLIFEDVIPKTASFLNLDNSYTYEDVFLGLLEMKAKSLEINNFKVFKTNELIEEIKKNNKKSKDNIGNSNIFDMIKEKIEILPTLSKKEAVLRIADIILDL